MSDANAEEAEMLKYMRASVEAAVRKPWSELREAVWPFVVYVPINPDGYLDVSNAVVESGSHEQGSAFRQIGESLQNALRRSQQGAD